MTDQTQGEPKPQLTYSDRIAWYVRRVYARLFRLAEFRIYLLRILWLRHFGVCSTLTIGALAAVGHYWFPYNLLDIHFSADTEAAKFGALIVAIGGALVGATAIAFSVVMFAMQVNIERMPHDVFRRLSTDRQLLGAFAATFLLSIAVACTSLLPKGLLSLATYWGAWATLIILLLFLAAYRRALFLVNPINQLRLIVSHAQKDTERWARRAKRAEPLLLEQNPENEKRSTLESTHDLGRLLYFRANPHWTMTVRRTVQHCASIARRYSENGDDEISAAALGAIVQASAIYIAAKGKTFFAAHAFLPDDVSTDGFINDTLEFLRQNVRAGIARGDEQQIEQTLRCFSNLVKLYCTIDYSNQFASKTHAQLAAGYLSSDVKALLPHKLADVTMEGLRLLGDSARALLASGEPNDITTLAQNISLIGAACASHENMRPVTLVAVEQISDFTLRVLQTEKHDIHYAAGELRQHIALISSAVMATRDSPLLSSHSSYLAPYYRGVFLEQLASTTNAAVEAAADNEAARNFIRNVSVWAEELYDPIAKLLQQSIEKRSHFTFDIVYWIKVVTKVLTALSTAPAASHHYREKLERCAIWAVSPLLSIPATKEAISFVENYKVTEVLFELAAYARDRSVPKIAWEITKLLFDWAWASAPHETGWRTFERSIYALVVLSVLVGSTSPGGRLKSELVERLTTDSPPPEIRNETARRLRARANDDEGLRYSAIDAAAREVDQSQLRSLLLEVAGILSKELPDD